MIVANDATVKGGTYFPMTVKKHLRAQEIALENRLPCVYLVDSGGAFLPLQAEVFPDREHFGRIFYNQARMSAAGIPQVAVVHGLVHRGRRLRAGDERRGVIVKNQGTIFLGGPPLVKAATGEEVTAEELGGGDVHTRISGVADHLADDDAHALADRARHLRPRCRRPRAAAPSRARRPSRRAYDPAEIYGIVPRDPRKRTTSREVIARLVDGSRFHEFKALYGTDARHRLRAPARLSGRHPRATTACSSPSPRSRRRTSSSSAAQRRVPLLFLQNITGFMVGKKYEHGGIAKDGAKMVHAVANAAGAEAHGHRRRLVRRRQLRHVRPRLLAALPLHVAARRISVMGGEQAASTLLTVKLQQLAGRGQTLSEEEQREVQGPDPRQVRGGGQPLLLDRAPLGRRHPRSRRDARRARARARRLALRADRRDALRRVPDVTVHASPAVVSTSFVSAGGRRDRPCTNVRWHGRCTCRASRR